MTAQPTGPSTMPERPDNPVIELIKFVVSSNAHTWRTIALMTSAAILATALLSAAALAGHALGLLGTAVVGGVPTLGALIAGALRHRRNQPPPPTRPQPRQDRRPRRRARRVGNAAPAQGA